MIDENDKREIQQMFDQWTRSNYDKRVGDTPTDALQLVNKRFADGKSVSTPGGSSIRGAATIVAGDNIAVSQNGSIITISSSIASAIDYQVFSVQGIQTWVKPVLATDDSPIFIQMWGGGGAGASVFGGDIAGGGGGGAYVELWDQAGNYGGSASVYVATSVASSQHGDNSMWNGVQSTMGSSSLINGTIAYGGGTGADGSFGGGGGGAGWFSGGGNGQQNALGGSGGSPGAGTNGLGADTTSGYGGGSGTQSVASGGKSIYGGGGAGGGSNDGKNGGNSLYGGAGGGGANGGVGGVSTFGGNGGNGGNFSGVAGNGADGQAPGGGGGGAEGGTSSIRSGGKGARGEIRVYTFY